jgi:hypothetical protein
MYFLSGTSSSIDLYLNETERKKFEMDSVETVCPVRIYAFHGFDIRHAYLGKKIVEKLANIKYVDQKKKVISYSLWGEKLIYTIGAIYNAKDAAQMYPDFECWFYIHEETVPKNIVQELAKLANVKIIFKTGDLTTVKPMMWRFLAIDDPEVEVMMSRDTDTRFTHREKLAVDEWLNSDAPFHIMRDHPHHVFPILGGMFGTRKIPEIISWKREMDRVLQTGTHQYDQTFLKDTIYEIIKEKAMIHANFHRIESNCRYFPTEYDPTFRFVGEYVNYDNTRIPDHIYSLKNEYYNYCLCPIHIISTFYISTIFVEKDVERNQELEDCLLKNLLSPTVEKIHLFVDNPESLQKYSENLIKIPKCFLLYQSINQDKPIIPRKTKETIILGSLNNEIKNSKDLLETWKKILEICPNTKLVIKLMSYDDLIERQKYYMSKLNVTKDRLLLITQLDNVGYNKLFSMVDIVLDTFPYSGTTTTCNSLYNSIPVVTLYNKDYHAHNVSSSILKNAGLDELIAYNNSDYISLVKKLVANPSKIDEYKETIGKKFVDSMNTIEFMQSYENILKQLHEKHVSCVINI